MKEQSLPCNSIQNSQKITLQFYSKQGQSIVQQCYPIEILKFNIELLNHNHQEPYAIPKQIVQSQYPFQVIKEFLEIHQYDPTSIKIVKPINSKDYKDLVDEKIFQVCLKFVHRQNANKATQVVILCRFLRYHQLHDAICAAIATNYYIPPNNDKELTQFKKIHKIDDLSSQQICEIIKEYEEIFNMIQTKAKQEFFKKQQSSESI